MPGTTRHVSRFNRIAFAFLLLPLTAGASNSPVGARQGMPESCQYTYKDLALAKLGKDKSYWKVRVGVSNPNPHPVSVESIRYSLLHRQDTLLTGMETADKVIPAGETLDVQSTLVLPNKELKSLPKEVLKDPEARFTLVGDAHLSTGLQEFVYPAAVRQTILVDMPKQVKKAKKMFFRRMFFR